MTGMSSILSKRVCKLAQEKGTEIRKGKMLMRFEGSKQKKNFPSWRRNKIQRSRRNVVEIDGKFMGCECSSSYFIMCSCLRVCSGLYFVNVIISHRSSCASCCSLWTRFVMLIIFVSHCAIFSPNAHFSCSPRTLRAKQHIAHTHA
jgi:hypothetical protein